MISKERDRETERQRAIKKAITEKGNKERINEMKIKKMHNELKKKTENIY